MLFRKNTLDQIATGDVKLAFRKWTRRGAKVGSLIKTRIGQLEILKESIVERDKITAADAKRAGNSTLEELLEILDEKDAGDIYRIELRYHSEDPRIALRENEDLSDEDREMLETKLARLDKFSKQGAWTSDALELIRKYPERRAGDLSDMMGKDKAWFKTNIRKLQNLGLTESKRTGYTISPRGEQFLKGRS